MEEESKNPRVRDLLAWKSFNRSPWQFSKEAFKTLALVCVLLSIILAFVQEWLAILLVWAAYFVFYQLTKVPPVEVEHKITTEGIVSMDKGYLWSDLGPFWFSVKNDHIMLHVLHRNILGQLMILVSKEEEEKVRDVLAEYLPYIEKPEKSTVEKLTDWFAAKFPLEKIVSPKDASPTSPS